MKMKSLILTLSYLALTIILCFGVLDAAELSYDYHLSKAREYGKLQKLDESIDEYKKAIELNPTLEDAHYELALTYYQKWQISFDEAQKKRIYDPESKKIIDFSRKEELEKEYERYGEKKEFKKLAMREFEETIKYNPDNWVARYHIATNHLNKESYDEAIKEYEQVIRIKSDYINSYGLMAKAYMKKGLYDMAITNYKHAISLDPTSEVDHYDLALAYFKIGKKEEAVKELEELKKLNSTFYDRLKRMMDNQ
jgi:tetratricopeptide (TPR) repeat protein